jgi:hypothetical protein
MSVLEAVIMAGQAMRSQSLVRDHVLLYPHGPRNVASQPLPPLNARTRQEDDTTHTHTP